MRRGRGEDRRKRERGRGEKRGGQEEETPDQPVNPMETLNTQIRSDQISDTQTDTCR